MKLIDTHTHLYLKEFENDIDEVIKKAMEEGVVKFYLPAIDSTKTDALVSLEKRYPNHIFGMIGLHPCSVQNNFEEEIGKIEAQLAQRSFAGIGETGLDYYWDTTFKKEQIKSLEIHAQWAIKYGLPLILHTRNANRETIDVVRSFHGSNLKGIFHCFSGTLEEAHEMIELGFVLGIGGVITFKNAGLAEVIQNIDLQHIVLETDSPYLAPVPFRGKRNESSYLKYVVQKLADIKKMTPQEVANITSANAERIFKEKRLLPSKKLKGT